MDALPAHVEKRGLYQRTSPCPGVKFRFILRLERFGFRNLLQRAVSKDWSCPGHQKIFSFFNSFKKLLCNFLKELKKENKVSCRRQRVVF
jgi:hypothetical protein